MGQHEYQVPLSPAKPEDIEAVAYAFRAGEQKATEEIIAKISNLSNLFSQTQLSKIINLIQE
jgi:hypothetical protein